ncbi:MAG: flippase-like domain-containing protein [Anaerolineae bacterium]|nr:flippase-like domain-containing protein [Anaerolineae bacterium]MCB9107502.1 flippase-like domain-containing protein [Anaerolineales bacterium]
MIATTQSGLIRIRKTLSNLSSKWYMWLGLLVSGLCLFIALRGLRLADVWMQLKTASYIWIVPGILVYFLAVWARTWRWHYLLRTTKIIPVRVMWTPVVIGYMGNNIFPFRAGEVLRAYVLKRKTGVVMGTGLATVVVERLFDGLVMLIFVLCGLPWVPNLPILLKQTVILASVVFLIALLVLFIWAINPERVRALIVLVTDRFAPPEVGRRILAITDSFTAGLSSLRSATGVTMVFMTSIVIWLLETVKYWFVMHAFSFTVTFFALMLMNGVVNLATTLPSTPGYVGTFDAPGIEILKIFGVAPAVAVSYTMILHAALWLPITLLGLWYMVKEGMSWQEFKQVAETKGQ